jgi:hypothetical protein
MGGWRRERQLLTVPNWLSAVVVNNAIRACGGETYSRAARPTLKVRVSESAIAKRLLCVCGWQWEVGVVVVGRCAE